MTTKGSLAHQWSTIYWFGLCSLWVFSFWEPKLIDRPLQEGVRILLRNSGISSFFQSEARSKLLWGWMYALQQYWFTSLHVGYTRYGFLSDGFQTGSCRKANVPPNYNLEGRKWNWSFIVIICEVHRLELSAPPVNRDLTFESKIMCFRRMSFCLQDFHDHFFSFWGNSC